MLLLVRSFHFVPLLESAPHFQKRDRCRRPCCHRRAAENESNLHHAGGEFFANISGGIILMIRLYRPTGSRIALFSPQSTRALVSSSLAYIDGIDSDENIQVMPKSSATSSL